MIEPQNWIFALSLAQPLPPVVSVSRKIRIAYLQRPTGVIGYYRIGVMGYYLQRAGLAEVRFQRDYKDDFEGMQDLHEMTEWADIIVMNRPWSYEELRFMISARQRGKLLVLDTDDHLDAVRELRSLAINTFWSDERIEMYRKGLALADLITVASKGLADHYRERWSDKVAYLPNPVDCFSERWNVLHQKYPDTPLRIVYGSGHTHNLEGDLLRLPLQRVLRARPHIEFVMAGDTLRFLADLAVEFPDQVISRSAVDYDKWPALLADADIALAPLVDHAFNRVRTDTKLFEMTMAGAALVASPVSCEFLKWRENETVLFAATPDEWVEKILYLVDHPEEIRRLNAAAVRYVLTYRAAPRLVSSWYKSYSDALKRFKPLELPYGSMSVDHSKASGTGG